MNNIVSNHIIQLTHLSIDLIIKTWINLFLSDKHVSFTYQVIQNFCCCSHHKSRHNNPRLGKTPHPMIGNALDLPYPKSMPRDQCYVVERTRIHTCIVTRRSSTSTSLVRKSAPIVALYWLENFLFTYWFMSEVLPTLESPMSMKKRWNPTSHLDGLPAIAEDNNLKVANEPLFQTRYRLFPQCILCQAYLQKDFLSTRRHCLCIGGNSGKGRCTTGKKESESRLALLTWAEFTSVMYYKSICQCMQPAQTTTIHTHTHYILTQCHLYYTHVMNLDNKHTWYTQLQNWSFALSKASTELFTGNDHDYNIMKRRCMIIKDIVDS